MGIIYIRVWVGTSQSPQADGECPLTQPSPTIQVCFCHQCVAWLRLLCTFTVETFNYNIWVSPRHTEYIRANITITATISLPQLHNTLKSMSCMNIHYEVWAITVSMKHQPMVANHTWTLIATGRECSARLPSIICAVSKNNSWYSMCVYTVFVALCIFNWLTTNSSHTSSTVTTHVHVASLLTGLLIRKFSARGRLRANVRRC